MLTKEMKSFKLRKSETMRSPGGTPLRPMDANARSPPSHSSQSSYLTSALRKKFQVRAFSLFHRTFLMDFASERLS